MGYKLAAKQEELMRRVISEVETAISHGDGPFAAMLIDKDGTILEIASNTVTTECNITAHAEINLLRNSGFKRKTRKFPGLGIIANAAPCSMCMSALVKAEVEFLIYGADNEPTNDPFITPEEVVAKSKHKVEIISGVLAEECVQQIVRGRQKITKDTHSS